MQQITITKKYEPKTTGELQLLADLDLYFPFTNPKSMFFMKLTFSLMVSKIETAIQERIQRNQKGQGFLRYTTFRSVVDNQKQEVQVYKVNDIKDDRLFLILKLKT